MLGVSALRFGAKNPAVKVLPVKLPALRRPIGVITLKGRIIMRCTCIIVSVGSRRSKGGDLVADAGQPRTKLEMRNIVQSEVLGGIESKVHGAVPVW
jgi:hypothetical protein